MLQDSEIYINAPDGFDARNCFIIQPCSPGILIELVTN